MFRVGKFYTDRENKITARLTIKGVNGSLFFRNDEISFTRHPDGRVYHNTDSPFDMMGGDNFYHVLINGIFEYDIQADSEYEASELALDKHCSAMGDENTIFQILSIEIRKIA